MYFRRAVPGKLFLSLGLFILLFATAACTISDQAECSSDDDCGLGQRCVASGGVVVQDGICVSIETADDVGDVGDTGPDADADAECEEPEFDCGGTCVDRDTDIEHCGECFNECSVPDGATGICSDGGCDFECDSGLERCGDQCVDFDDDADHCGSCTNACENDEICEASSCELVQCEEPESNCDGECVNEQTNIDHCGECGFSCTTEIDGANPTCESGECGIDCDDEEDTLCSEFDVCVDLDTDSEHCGECGLSCGDNEVCDGQECVCATGFVDCDGECVDTETNSNFCGDCSTQCDGIDVCVDSGCTDSCPGDDTACSGSCFDLETSLDHCQGCGNACTDDIVGGSPICTESGCDYECDNDDHTVCIDEGLCADLSNDDENCGSCGNTCSTTVSGSVAFCENSSCVEVCSDSGETVCEDEGICTDTDTDPENCGDCGDQCETTITGAVAICDQGDCQEQCSDTDATICTDLDLCANLDDDPEHCGSCGNVCDDGLICADGDCFDESACDPSASPFGGGDGTADEPWRICTAAHLNQVGFSTTYLADYFEVFEDIDMENVNFNVIGSSSNPFSGTFRGENFEIANLSIDLSGSSYVGLFGHVDDDGAIEATHLANVDILGGDRVGGLVGRNRGTINNATVSGHITGSDWYAGGLVGENNGTIADSSHLTGTVEGNGNMIGGLAGRSDGTVVSSSSSSDEVIGSQRVGGLVGHNVGEISESSSTAAVVADSLGGGLVGYNSSGEISESHASGNVSGEERLGGLVGESSDGTVSDSYAEGDVSGVELVGGLIAFTNSTITGCHATGAIQAEQAVAGGLVGVNDGEIFDSYATGVTTSQAVSGGFAGSNSGIIESSYATGNAESEDQAAGGLVGENIGTISDSYASGSAHTALGSGGLVGANGGTISRCHAFGPVSGTDAGFGGLVGANISSYSPEVENSYWDEDTTGQGNSAGGQPLSTNNFSTTGSFPGWNFSTVWELGEADDGNERPIMQWQ